MEENKIKERILEIISYYKLNPNKFSESIGMSRAYVKNMKNEISSKAIRNILNLYPQINLYWLITGDGDMLRNMTEEKESDLNNISLETLNTFKQILDQKRQEIASKDLLIQELNKEIGRLSAALNTRTTDKREYNIEVTSNTAAEKRIKYKKK